MDESETNVVKDICNLIKNNNGSIPEDELSDVVVAMYLNILEYIEKDEQETYIEMIKMSEEYEGVITKIRNEGFDEGKRVI